MKALVILNKFLQDTIFSSSQNPELFKSKILCTIVPPIVGSQNVNDMDLLFRKVDKTFQVRTNKSKSHKLRVSIYAVPPYMETFETVIHGNRVDELRPTSGDSCTSKYIPHVNTIDGINQD